MRQGSADYLVSDEPEEFEVSAVLGVRAPEVKVDARRKVMGGCMVLPTYIPTPRRVTTEERVCTLALGMAAADMGSGLSARHRTAILAWLGSGEPLTTHRWRAWGPDVMRWLQTARPALWHRVSASAALFEEAP